LHIRLFVDGRRARPFVAQDVRCAVQRDALVNQVLGARTPHSVAHLSPSNRSLSGTIASLEQAILFARYLTSTSNIVISSYCSAVPW
jgi:hypothetical protein